MTDSINYAVRIQRAVLPSEDYINELFQSLETLEKSGGKNYFILFRPKDIVSGDFYWAKKVNEYLIVTVADCTGHGVPGAFMSMLGISFLNEIVRKNEVTEAAQVLEYLRNNIIESLMQKGTLGEQKDGMDISLCAINTKTMLCQWAGANIPLWIVRPDPQGHIVSDGATGSHGVISGTMPASHSVTNAESDLAGQAIFTEIKPDKQPTAIHLKMAPFINHEIQLHQGDRLYMFSDGFTDQFGGPKGKKFTYNVFKQIIIETSKLPMPEQSKKLEKALDEWMCYNDTIYEQIDDITVVGMKI
ncbi:MAG: SpoIIE family protein phosphatase [Bacteroidia bacterium]|nr:SpoIIE family protein phosphatase [Bacteroidia bacterium]